MDADNTPQYRHKINMAQAPVLWSRSDFLQSSHLENLLVSTHVRILASQTKKEGCEEQKICFASQDLGNIGCGSMLPLRYSAD